MFAYARRIQQIYESPKKKQLCSDSERAVGSANSTPSIKLLNCRCCRAHLGQAYVHLSAFSTGMFCTGTILLNVWELGREDLCTVYQVTRWIHPSLCGTEELSCNIKLPHFLAQGTYVFGAVNWWVPCLAATLHGHLLMTPHLVWSADALVRDGALHHAHVLQQENIIQGVASLLLGQSFFTNIFFQGKGESASYGAPNFLISFCLWLWDTSKWKLAWNRTWTSFKRQNFALSNLKCSSDFHEISFPGNQWL